MKITIVSIYITFFNAVATRKRHDLVQFFKYISNIQFRVVISFDFFNFPLIVLVRCIPVPYLTLFMTG